MNDTGRYFLKILQGMNSKEAVTQASLPDDFVPEQFFSLAELHELLPFCIENVSRGMMAGRDNIGLYSKYSDQAVNYAIRQITKKNEFLTLLLHLKKKGLEPAVIKGEILRVLYPKAYYRPSVDDDLLIAPKDLYIYHRALLEEGLEADDPSIIVSENDAGNNAEIAELSYHKPGSPLYIELHTALFPPKSDVYGDCNRFFHGVMDRTVSVQIEDVPVRTLCPKDHFLYLILHSYKHFLHCGFGIRHICDLVLFAETYGEQGQLDWDYLYQACESQHILQFTAAMFKIGQNCMGFDLDKAGMSENWKLLVRIINAKDLTEDILQAGLNGANLNRAHSSSITLNAVSEDKTARKEADQIKKEGKKVHRSFAKKQVKAILKTVFPPAENLEGEYTYLKGRPYLLPAAWGSRLLHYLKEHFKNHDVSARESIELGRERIALLKEYQIID